MGVRKRTFNNERFILHSVRAKKSEANTVARYLRDNGWKVRVTLEGKIYHIWKNTTRSRR